MSGINQMSRKIHVVGLSTEKESRFSRPAEQAIISADTIIGSNRQLDLVAAKLEPDLLAGKQQLPLPKLSELSGVITRSCESSEMAILASGDPHFFGIGHWLDQNCGYCELHFHPAVSSVQSVCNRLGLALQDCEVISLHGRDLCGLHRNLKRNRTLVVLTDQFSHPRALARACIDAGFADSAIHICEDLGTDCERYRQFVALELASEAAFECSALHVSVIQVRGPGGVLPEFPGIPDESYASDGAVGQGMFTKREVRLAILALMQPASGDLIWDVGAGCGGVSIELAHWNARVLVYAIEQNRDRFACLAANQVRFGVTDNLHLVQGRAPGALMDLPAPNKVFLGGNDGELNTILNASWSRLPERGVLVASAITHATEERLQEFALELGREHVESLKLLISKGEQQDTDIHYREKLPVTLFKFTRSQLLT